MRIIHIIKRQKCRIVISLVVFLIIFHTIYLLTNLSRINVPNVVHYIIFKNSSLDFITFLSMTSVIKIHKPQIIKVHTNSSSVRTGRFSKLIDDLAKKFGVEIIYKKCDVPTHVYGQRLSSLYHSSDVKRLSVLSEEGGIYLDTDSLVLKPLYEFFKYETTLACPENDYVGNQVILAAKDSRFINLWLKSYKHYQPTRWYSNAGKYGTYLLNKNPKLVMKLTQEFGVQNLLAELYTPIKWKGWKSLYAIHLLSRHPPSPQNANENMYFQTAFGDIINFILYETEPKLKDGTWNL